MKSESKKRVRHYLVQTLLQLPVVVVGILIALQVENWNEAGKLAAQRDVLIQKIRTELVTNRALIRQALPARRQFLKQLQERSDAWDDAQRRGLYLSLPENEQMTDWPGLIPTRLEVSLFETAKFTGLLTDLDPALLAQLSHVYGNLITINSLGREMMGQMFELDYETRVGDALRLFWRIQEEFFGAQELLLPKLDQLVEAIDRGA